MPPLVSVVIPFFQERPGLLRRSVESAVAQRGIRDLEVIIVDDGSPISAAAELEVFETGGPPLRLIEQENRGPGAARNTALNKLDTESRFVAFLDSDDTWEEDHLARAVEALDRGYDVYVSNWMPLESSLDAYTHFRKLDPAEHPPLEGLRDVHRFAGDFFKQELTRPVGRLSTMVYAREPFADLRFNVKLRNAFEDRLFRMEMAARNPRVVFSTRVECHSGHGVNLYSSREPGTIGWIDTMHDQLLAVQLIRQKFSLDDSGRPLVDSLLAGQRQEFLYSVLRVLRDDRKLPISRIWRHLRADPLFPFLLPRTVTALLRRRAGPSE